MCHTGQGWWGCLFGQVKAHTGAARGHAPFCGSAALARADQPAVCRRWCVEHVPIDAIFKHVPIDEIFKHVWQATARKVGRVCCMTPLCQSGEHCSAWPGPLGNGTPLIFRCVSSVRMTFANDPSAGAAHHPNAARAAAVQRPALAQAAARGGGKGEGRVQEGSGAEQAGTGTRTRGKGWHNWRYVQSMMCTSHVVMDHRTQARC